MKPSWHWTNQPNAEEIKEKLKKTLRHDNWLGKQRSKETIKKLNEGKEKWIKENPELYQKLVLDKLPRMVGADNPNWKGDRVGYGALHAWVVRNFGKPLKCEHCGSTENIEWANKSQKYTRDRYDWLQLCKSCHKKYDMKQNNRQVWNKGKKATSAMIEKNRLGHLGQRPWNKGLKISR